MSPIVALVVGVLVSLGFLYVRWADGRDRRKLEDRAGNVALRPGLEDLDVGPGGQLHGVRRGVAVRITPGPSPRIWRVTADAGFVLPSRVKVEAGVDSDGRVNWGIGGGPHTDLRWLLDSPEIDEPTKALVALGVSPSLTDGPAANVPFDELSEAVDHVVDLALALQMRRSAAVNDVMRQLGHPTAADPCDVETVAGEVDGIPLEITLPRVELGWWRAELVVTLASPLPPGTELRYVPEGSSTKIGDVVLDNAPVDIRTDDPVALRHRLGKDAVRGPLLDELCANHESVLLERELRLVRRDGALDVRTMIERGVELGRALG